MKSQIGRSMIEMLGVLAIIGVLSIGGLAGYRKAITTYRGLNIMDYYNRCAVAGIARYRVDGTLDGTCNGEDGVLSGEAFPYYDPEDENEELGIGYSINTNQGQISVYTENYDFCDIEKYNNICDFFSEKHSSSFVNGVKWTNTSAGTAATYKM